MKKSAIIEEVKEVLSITLFFFFCFLVFLIMKKAFLAQYEIKYSGFFYVIVQSLILGKVVVILDKMAVTRKFDHLRNSTRILFRSTIYLVGYVLFTFIEHGMKALFSSNSIGEAISHNFYHLTSVKGLATLLILFITFLIFNVFWILRMHLGPKKLFDLYFGE